VSESKTVPSPTIPSPGSPGTRDPFPPRAARAAAVPGSGVPLGALPAITKTRDVQRDWCGVARPRGTAGGG